MTKLAAFIVTLFNSPSDFMGDPEGWVNNQSAHALLVGGGLMLLMVLLGLIGWFDPMSPGTLLVVISCYGIWESMQLSQGDSTILDGIADWAFVSTGAVLVRSGLVGDTHTFMLCISGLVLALCLGVLRRL